MSVRNLMAVLSLTLCTSAALSIAEETFVTEPVWLPSATEPQQTLRMVLVADVPDIKKLETRAIAVVRKKYGYSLARAREVLRVDGKTNVQLCMQELTLDAISKITQLNSIAVTIGLRLPPDIAEETQSPSELPPVQ